MMRRFRLKAGSGRTGYGHREWGYRRCHPGREYPGFPPESAQKPDQGHLGLPDAFHVHGEFLPGLWKGRIYLVLWRISGVDRDSLDECQSGCN